MASAQLFLNGARVNREFRNALLDAANRAEASVDAAIAECGGDVRATIWELLTERAHMEAEAARLAGAVSQGFVRDALR